MLVLEHGAPGHRSTSRNVAGVWAGLRGTHECMSIAKQLYMITVEEGYMFTQGYGRRGKYIYSVFWFFCRLVTICEFENGTEAAREVGI